MSAGGGRYRWVVLWIGVGTQAAGGGLVQGLPSVAPALRRGYGLELAQVGIALGSVLTGMTLALLGWGMLADRIGERPVTVVGSLGAGVALAAAAATSSFAGLAACLLVAGAMAASVNVSVGRALVSWFGPDERGTVMGIRQASIPVGGATAAALLPLLAGDDRPQRALLALAAALVIAALVAAVWMREAPLQPASAGGGGSPLRDKQIWRVAGASALLSSVQFALIGFLVLYLYEERGVGLGVAAGALVALQLGGAVARIVVGRWSDRRQGRLGALRRLGAAETLALAATAALVAAGAGNGPVLVALGVAGLLAMCWNGLAFAAAAEMASEGRSGTALGLETTALALGGAAALPIFGALVAATSWGAGFTLLALVSLAASWIWRTLHLRELRSPGAGEPLSTTTSVAP